MSVALSLSSGTAGPGGAISLDLSITSTGGDQPTQVQWTFSYGSDLTLAGVVIGAVGTAASKTLSAAGDLSLVWGINTNVIGNGILATATFHIAAIPVGSSAQIFINDVVVSDADGNQLGSSSTPGTITISNPTPPTPGGLPCDNVTPQPETDIYFRLEKVMACIRPDAHLPVRGSTR